MDECHVRSGASRHAINGCRGCYAINPGNVSRGFEGRIAAILSDALERPARQPGLEIISHEGLGTQRTQRIIVHQPAEPVGICAEIGIVEQIGRKREKFVSRENIGCQFFKVSGTRFQASQLYSVSRRSGPNHR
jgi:hypothetical protein